ncbi:MAG TPA: LEA type 2 family protein [Arenimonas sp.]|nr:LEA type 2 family protein [Arenimonas sp.]
MHSLCRISVLHVLATALLLGLLGSCASLPDYDPPRVNVAGIEPVQGEGMELRFNVKLRIQNPNTVEINYQGMMVDLMLDGNRVASGVSNQPGNVPAYGETVYTLPVTVSVFDAARQFIGFLQNPQQSVIPYEINGKLESGLFGSVRFSDKGSLKLPQ